MRVCQSLLATLLAYIEVIFLRRLHMSHSRSHPPKISHIETYSHFRYADASSQDSDPSRGRRVSPDVLREAITPPIGCTNQNHLAITSRRKLGVRGLRPISASGYQPFFGSGGRFSPHSFQTRL
ncbi:hypothetical protein CPB84DRAFT_1310996 [Gymnopilus junonius]|uniref:Uncharacterized protein n=1 Tax=Gymnopilus junonius TaxID=109634 RepID=A0A9P5TLX1_GYMJU|nr:hypothetical protein CPB84DRAFT_1310996 [Gymnopilus junonius]